MTAVMDPVEAVARESIRDLVARYNAAGDVGDVDTVAALFAPDAVMEVEGVAFSGREAVREMFAGVASSTGDEQLAAYIRHFTATHQIDMTGPDAATGRCYYQTLTERGLDHWGRYVDRYAVIDGRWHFAHRRVTIDGMIPDGWCARMRARAIDRRATAR